MDKSGMVKALVEYYTGGNKSQFANMLDVSAQTISAWVARNTFDAELIFTKCKNVSAEWLLSGKGEMIKNQQSENVSIDSNLVELCKELIKNYQQRDDVMNKLVSMVGNMM